SLNYLLFVPAGSPPVAFDNFNDGNDTYPTIAWQRYNPLGVATFSFPGGNTYRIQSAPSPDPVNFGQARAASLVASLNQTDFYVAADLVAWDDTIHQICGVMARITTPGPGTTSGYLFTHDRGNPANPGGDMDIVRVDGEVPTSLTTLPSGGDAIHLEPGKQ